MKKYGKGSVFAMEVNEQEEIFSVIEKAKVNEAEYILAVPIEPNETGVTPILDGVVAFQLFDDGTLSVETDEAIVSQIVNQIIP